jgi:uncharacterized membrane protein (Fun14 family)
LDASQLISLVLGLQLPQLGFLGIVGFVVGWAFKKVMKLLAIIAGVIIGLFMALLYALSGWGIITINQARLSMATEQASTWAGTQAVIMANLVTQLGSITLAYSGSFLVGGALGFKKG